MSVRSIILSRLGRSSPTFNVIQKRPRSDAAWIRCFMLYLLLVETANVVVEFGIIYEPLITQYGEAAAIITTPRHATLISIVSGPIQLFTAWRISVITGSLVLPAFISLLSLGSFAGGITVSVMVYLNPEFKSFELFRAEVIVWLMLSAACDVVIAVGMTWALYVRKTGFGVIDGQINRIIRLTVETGALTAITALVDVMLFLLFPVRRFFSITLVLKFRQGTTLNFIVDFPLSALYTCSILAMLNSRDRRNLKSTDAERATNAAAVQMLTQDQTTVIAGALKTPRSSFYSAKKACCLISLSRLSS
ncbi:hypothetical protein K438DRAFT_1755338 [Mycena galopus ATCC 62051]|nr:hypothetical protein K438DRAFT_1755338 [Mycena galopus ATCC 62051]